MNIKGKHLALCRFIQKNRGIATSEAVKAGFELTMINSLRRKGVLSHPVDKLYLPKETENRISVRRLKTFKDSITGKKYRQLRIVYT